MELNWSNPPVKNENSVFSAGMLHDIVKANKQVRNNITLHEYEVVEEAKQELLESSFCWSSEVFPKVAFIGFGVLTVPFAIAAAIALIVFLATMHVEVSKVNLGYSQACIFDTQCLNNLKCISRKCSCDLNKTYNGTACRKTLSPSVCLQVQVTCCRFKESLKTRKESCSSSEECDFKDMKLTCIDSICDCFAPTSYYDTSTKKCASYLFKDDNCQGASGKCNSYLGSNCQTCGGGGGGGGGGSCKKCT